MGEPRMRVLFWSELFWPHIGGAERFGANLVSALRELGHDVVVVTRLDDPDLPPTETYRGTPVYRFPFYSALFDGDIEQLAAIRRQVAQLKRAFQPDLVHVNCFGPSVLFLLDTARGHPTPLLLTLHGEQYPAPTGLDTLLAQTLASADWVTVPAEATASYAQSLVPGLKLRLSTIHNGVELSSLEPAPLPFEAPRLLYLGRLAAEKGADRALEALALLLGRFPQVRLIVAGDGPDRAALERQAAGLRLGQAVEFRGWVPPPDVPALINTCTLVLLPSRRESLPLVALEAAAMARPVVAIDVGGVAELVLHRRTGMLASEGDSHGLAAATAFLLEHPRAARQMGLAARHRVQEQFSWDRCVDAYERLYRDILGMGAQPFPAMAPVDPGAGGSEPGPRSAPNE
jgi:glycogen(starch) synthase